MAAVDVISTPFSPLRSAVLSALRTPASATEVAERLGSTRQRVNYHVRCLEQAGLVELVEERRRRGCTERVMRATCGAVVVEPRVVGFVPEEQDRFAADTILEGGARLVRDVAAARTAASARGQRLLTFAVEAEVGFEKPSDVERFTDALAEAIASVASEFGGRRRYRMFLGGVPA